MLNNHGGGYSYRLCPADEPLSEKCFMQHPLDFVETEQAVVDRNGKLTKVPDPVFVSEGTTPPGSQWAMIPIPTNALGPRCLPGPNDTATTPHACQPWESKLVAGPCQPCPGTPGSDCSRCDNNWDGTPSFPPPCPSCKGSDHKHAIRDIVKIPATLKAGRYVLSWRYVPTPPNIFLDPVTVPIHRLIWRSRYDCEATAQVWENCADVTLVK